MLARYVCATAVAIGGGVGVRAGRAQQVQSQVAPSPQASPAQNARQNQQQNVQPQNSSPAGQQVQARQQSSARNLSNAAAEDARFSHPQLWFGVASEQIAPAIARQLKLRPDQGLMVLDVLANSPAAKAGLHADDLLIELNGKPLTSPDELSAAANSLTDAPDQNAPAAGQNSTLVFLRDGDRHSVTITPSPRPEDLRIIPAESNVLASKSGAPLFLNGNAIGQNLTNYVAPNGNALQVGPGFQLNLRNNDAATVEIRKAMDNGKKMVVVSQETDSAGHVRISITQDDKTYAVESGHIDTLPENLRGLGQQLLDTAARPQQNAATPTAEEMARQINDQQAQIQQLNARIDRLMDTLSAPATRPAAVPATPAGSTAP